jgi:hypothetical protein
MQGFRNYTVDAINMQQDLMPHQYNKTTPPPSPPAGKLKQKKKMKITETRH